MPQSASTRLPPERREQLVALVREHGVVRAAALLGCSRHATARALADALEMRTGTVMLLESRLRRLTGD